MTWSDRLSRWALMLVLAALTAGCGGAAGAMTELQRNKAGELEVVLLSPREALQHGQDSFVFEFRKNGSLVDVGEVRARASMPMPGMPMFASVDVQRTAVAGRYAASSRFDMAGTWRTTVEWDGAGGQGAGSVAFSGSVR
jgi:hypothetical protein